MKHPNDGIKIGNQKRLHSWTPTSWTSWI